MRGRAGREHWPTLNPPTTVCPGFSGTGTRSTWWHNAGAGCLPVHGGMGVFRHFAL
jgi:hypothetical protein